MDLRPILPLILITCGAVSVIYSASISAAGRLLGSSLWSPPLAYSEALPILLAYTLCTEDTRPSIETVLAFVKEKPWVNCQVLFGGLMGALIGIGASYIPPRIGMGPFFVLFVTGQVLAALVMDTTGLYWATQIPTSWRTLIGNVLVIVGAVIFQWRSLQDFGAPDRELTTLRSFSVGVVNDGAVTHEPQFGRNLWTSGQLIVCSLIAGSCAVAQGGINSRLMSMIGMYTAIYSFGSGLLILIALASLVDGRPKFEMLLSVGWKDSWKLFGGVLSISSLLAVMILPRLVGFALTASWMITGELILSLVSDHYGWFELKRRRADLTRILGVLLVLLGVTLTQVSRAKLIKETARRGARSWVTAAAALDSPASTFYNSPTPEKKRPKRKDLEAGSFSSSKALEQCAHPELQTGSEGELKTPKAFKRTRQDP